MIDIIDELLWREQIAQSTDLGALHEALSAGPMTLYCGFDPTAPSLHLGNLAQILTVRRFQQAGHRPLALVGGATGLIGDPKSTGERTLNSEEIVQDWVGRIRAQLERFYDFDGPNAAVVVNNYDWTKSMSVLEFLRDIGKHFSVNRMLDREAVAARLAKDGISYTEFSYQLLQSFDFLELFRRYGCVLQTGGSDQWGNITAGVDLIRRTEQTSVHALTTPLLTKADGSKFGKTETGTIWLDPALTSPYDFFQFWLNADDRDVKNLLHTFSFKSREEIAELLLATEERPHERAAQRALAEELTDLVHGLHERESAEAAGRALFGHGDLAALPHATLAAALREAAHAGVQADEVIDGALPSIDELLTRSGLVSSKSAARRTIAEGGAYANNERITDENWRPTTENLLHGEWLVLRRGKRSVAGIQLFPSS
ncbi:MAG: tyrosine--tRNA ligase [Actinomycetota bacterium]|nr:tyrosine--tRNA ligase [Actinomycetota bacterium]